MSKNFDEIVRLQSQKQESWTQELIGERLQGIAEDASRAPRLASLSAALFSGRNECLGTNCSLTEQKEKKTVPARSAMEIKVKGKTEERTEWRGQNESQIVGEEKRNGRLVGAAETSKERAE